MDGLAGLIAGKSMNTAWAKRKPGTVQKEGRQVEDADAIGIVQVRRSLKLTCLSC